MPILSKTTATWCPRCGDWGWSFMEEMKDEFEDGSAMVLGVHYLGSTLENETAIWFADNLGSIGQPRFYVNNTNISVTGANWQDQIQVAKDERDALLGTTVDVLGVSSADLDGNVLRVQVNVNGLTDPDAYLGVYIYEDKVEASQAGGVSDDIHPNVLRAAMSVDPEGIAINNDGFWTFNKSLESDWVRDELGVLLILWQKVDDNFIIRSSQAIDNIIARSGVEGQLEESDFEIIQNVSSITINASESGAHNLSLNDMTGRAIVVNKFEQQITIDHGQVPSGQYILLIERDGKYMSKKIFINQ